ncbi:hypothetical protein PPTG_22539 [Phytophthora nicotianae INRA-310]|uniref:Uncharacterized protein n=1 Tax=Phytophthora nicotianae (strain INRA-310) TaxID=761204 RepID=W2QF64_PHYN3|nr:hypothetical protein PPTG_22539 [Phytophthora nicotianae INRA-310]ETN11787.1 hypothetical protein PPTG_22539 [Phytophthora nicotianae INRA-310]
MLHGSDLKKYKSADCFNMRTKQSRGAGQVHGLEDSEPQLGSAWALHLLQPKLQQLGRNW